MITGDRNIKSRQSHRNERRHIPYHSGKCRHRPSVIIIVRRLKQSVDGGWSNYDLRGIVKHNDNPALHQSRGRLVRSCGRLVYRKYLLPFLLHQMFSHTAVKHRIYLILIDGVPYLLYQLRLRYIFHIEYPVLCSGSDAHCPLFQLQMYILDPSPYQSCGCPKVLIEAVPRPSHSSLGGAFLYTSHREMFR